MLDVMIIEDELSALDRYTEYVENYSDVLQVSAKARTSDEGVILFHEHKPDIIFTDIKIPGKNGLELASDFRKTGWDGELVIISGYNDFPFARKAIQIMVTDYLLKPVFQDDFNKILERLLSKRDWKTLDCQSKNKDQSSLSEHIQRTIQFIDIHLEQEITLNEAAEYAYVSPSYLSSSFHKSLGSTFIQYIKNTRVEKAKSLLKTTCLPLKDIGEKCGFKDLSYFHRTFKRMTGVSPGQYRST